MVFGQFLRHILMLLDCHPGHGTFGDGDTERDVATQPPGPPGQDAPRGAHVRRRRIRPHRDVRGQRRGRGGRPGRRRDRGRKQKRAQEEEVPEKMTCDFTLGFSCMVSAFKGAGFPKIICSMAYQDIGI